MSTRPMADHVRRAVLGGAQTKAAPRPQEMAPHVRQMIAGGAQPKVASAGSPVRPTAAHVQRSVAVQPPAGPMAGGGEVLQRMRYGSGSNQPQTTKLEFTSSTDATTCIMIVFRGSDLVVVDAERLFTSGGGLHAEEKAIARLQALVNNGTLTPQGVYGAKDYIVYLAVSKSPCSSTSIPATRTDGSLGCLERLTALNTNGLTNLLGNTVTFSVQLAATKPYSPKIVGGKNSSINNYGGFGGGGTGGGTFGFLRT